MAETHRQSRRRSSRWRARVWWAVHNLVAHPLMVLLPACLAMPLHDVTARKAIAAGGSE